MNIKHFILGFAISLTPLSSAALTLATDPLFIASTEPRVMLLLSRDHELSKKAYNDYSDLDNDGNLDITYNDAVNYYGYFNSSRCYTYSSGNSRFEPAAAATGTNLHHCSGQWSGNFLNWATMTRLDVVRKVLYGGFRSADGTGTAAGATVLERAFLPPDVHAFAKVFAPNNAATVALYTPYSVANITLCNVSDMAANTQAGSINTVNGSATSPPPLIKVASGAWTEWGMTEIFQCQWKEQTVEPSPTRPSTVLGHRLTGANDLVARVSVCEPNKLESNCKTYVNSSTNAQTVKPIGLLQQYGDVDANRRVRFGLISGSYKNNTAGGVLRKNIKLLSGSATAADNEVDMNSGQFLNQGSSDAGIVNTLNRIHIAGYKTPAAGAITSTQVCSSGYNNSAPYACSAANLLSGTNGTCVDWGNPLSEMYHEALRYFAGKTAATAAYATDDGAATAVIAGVRQATWNSSSDPLPSTEWCALSNIIILSTGLSSLDNSTITSDITGLNAATLTDAVGTAEGYTAASQVLIGSNGATSTSTCSAKALSNGLSGASGICPEVPHMKGGYLIAGLANSSRSLDLRPGYATNRSNRWTGINANWVARQPLGTFAVSLAENLPSFEVAVPAGAATKVTIVPSCRSGGSTICSMTDLRVLSYSATAGSFLVSWEDNSAGSDYDMDTIARIDYTVSGSNLNVTVSVVQSTTGSNMELGYTVSGSNNDGTYFPIKIGSTGTCDPTQASNAFSLLTSPFTSRPAAAYLTWPACPGGSPTLPTGIVNATGCPLNQAGGAGANCGCPKTWTFTQSGTSPVLLKNPLWYAAKYGNPSSSWDLKNNLTGATTPDGEPDNFYDVRNPAGLYTALAAVFDAASQPDAAASSVATNSNNLQVKTRIYRALFSSADWSGQLLQEQLAYNPTTNTVTFSTEWDAGSIINSQNPTTGRVILTKGASDGVAFASANLTASQTTALNTDALGANDGLASSRIAYLRGDASNEGIASPSFRQRPTSKLGDTVNSNPWYVDAPSAGYSNLDHPGYGSFRSTYANRAPMIYVGGNDGMLHGFDASLDFTSTPVGQLTTDSGKEKLAYIPSAVYANLSRLTFLNYNRNHRFFVDGSPMVADADLTTSGTPDWRTVLIGGLGGGGKGYYALDITNPAGFSESGTAPADILLWEFDEADMGYAFTAPPAKLSNNQAKQIVKLCTAVNVSGVCTTPKWAAILSNGYNSTNGKAVLYVVFIADGIDGTWSSGDVIKLVADSPTAADNGLSTPVPIDTDGDGFVDTVYAGDLKGNMWKFLIGPNASDNTVTVTSSSWKVAFSNTNCGATTPSTCNPLFIAKNSSNQIQPIVWPAEVTLHPTSGQLVMFGTGKYLESSDNSNTQVQSLYGIWDQHTSNSVPAPPTPFSPTATVARANLLQQTLSFQSISNGTTTSTFPVASSNAINYPTHKGWYIDLTTYSKERATGVPKLINGVINFTSLIPSVSPCDAGGDGWEYALSYYNGGLISFPMFATNAATVAASTTLVSGFHVGATIGGVTFIPGISGNTGVMIWQNLTGTGGGGSGPGAGGTGVSLGANLQSRVSWREIVQ